MEGLVFTIFENLDLKTLSYEESMDCLYYLDTLLEREEGPESFIKYHLLKIKVELRLKEVNKQAVDRITLNLKNDFSLLV